MVQVHRLVATGRLVFSNPSGTRSKTIQWADKLHRFVPVNGEPAEKSTGTDVDDAYRSAASFMRITWFSLADRFRAAAAAALAFFARATRCADVIVSRERFPPIRPPFAPCSRK